MRKKVVRWIPVPVSLMLRWISPPVDNPPKPWLSFAQALNRDGTGQAGVGGYFNGGTTGFARGAPCLEFEQSRKGGARKLSEEGDLTGRIHATTVLSVRHKGKVVLAGDGQVSLQHAIMKHTARKVRRIYHDKVLAGFAGATADA